MTAHRNGKAIHANVRELSNSLWDPCEARVITAGRTRLEPTVLVGIMYVVGLDHAVAIGGKVAVARRECDWPFLASIYEMNGFSLWYLRIFLSWAVVLS